MKFLLLAFTLSSLSYAATVKREFPSKGINVIELKNGSGDTRISATKGTQIKIVANRKEADSCEVEFDQGLSAITVSVKSSGMFNSCERVDIIIETPAHVDLDIQSGSGDVAVDGMKGDIEYELGSGNIKLDNIKIAELDGKSGSGNVKISGVISDGSLKVGSGNVKVTLEELPQDGALDLLSGSGDASIRVPKNSRVNTEYFSGSGRLRNEVGDDENAPFSISMKAGSGDLSIKKM